MRYLRRGEDLTTSLDVYKAWLRIFPISALKVTRYSLIMSDTIKFKTYGGDTLIFRYTSDDDWSLQTYKSYTK